ncbi:MAG TPA: hypothetical protein VGV40_03870, partial [Solirubrobacteraceae bacterium]|nr:hypothetical protein [Solirubrobacteraceae bacterium]
MRPGPGELERGDVRADAVDTARYVAALRRNAALMATIVAVITGGVALASLLVPKSYEATTDILVIERDALSSASAESDSLLRRLATLRTLVTTPAVLAPAADQLSVDAEALEDRVTASTDQEADVLSISATAESAEAAQQTANAVARSFVEQQSQTQRIRLRTVIDRLSRDIDQLQDAGADPGSEELRALQERRVELLVAEAAAGADLQVARPAGLPEAASAPHPLRNAVLAFFGSFFLAVLVGLARDQLRPRPTARELSQILSAPILAKLPDSERRISRRRPPTDGAAAYRTLATLLRLALPAGGRHSVLVTSTVHGEGKTTVVQRLGASLAETGQRTLVVSADLRRPDLDALYGVQGRPGLWELLVGSAGTVTDGAGLRQVIVAPGNDRPPTPDVLPSGSRGVDPGDAFDPRAISALLDAIWDLDYAFVICDGPPALGDLPDGAVLASECDQVLIVARLARVSASEVVDLRERL